MYVPQKSIGLSIPELDVLQSSLYQLAYAYYRGGEYDDALLVISALLPSAQLFQDPNAPRQHSGDAAAKTPPGRGGRKSVGPGARTASPPPTESLSALGFALALLRGRVLLQSGRLLLALHWISAVITRIEVTIHREFSQAARAAKPKSMDADEKKRSASEDPQSAGKRGRRSVKRDSVFKLDDAIDGMSAKAPASRSDLHSSLNLIAVARLYYLRGKVLQALVVRPGAVGYPFGDTPPITTDARQRYDPLASDPGYDQDEALFGFGMHVAAPVEGSRRAQSSRPLSLPSSVYRSPKDVLNGALRSYARVREIMERPEVDSSRRSNVLKSRALLRSAETCLDFLMSRVRVCGEGSVCTMCV